MHSEMTLQTATSKKLFDIFKKAAELHDNIAYNPSNNAYLIVEVIPYLEEAMGELGLEIHDRL